MALNADLLGQQLYDKANEFNDVDIDNIDEARRKFWKGVATEIITHLQTNAILNVPGVGLIAGPYAVAGNSVTGKIQ
ncbi:2-polyprenyl-3-methyl-5-hydroxy-6-metoxy-1,4-benzoquinol methylase [Filimonas zeae]|uniref:Uncharacterized protein n=1 Tax=Filimonas zeae TaxID=1737353 RepID=A0A917N015_9BACT|nr:hypothetical protein [Filimonas zeae]MDR6340871.1 2-polyprenyl-3-methyl-5-hydroxy-6-metoxy-1,4-benzoquinol methylase [Filimonas zeae]GGH78125.1 hypothetical protein GCM10011379_45530 [Filimonas zeae]